ncbi:MAG: site-specific integrase [Bacteroidales bacterium]|nr:site-specific integrase [Bacteroidales bacterium]MBR1577748.1 site-specific integrase [Bacteroidales bacterium]
MKVEIKERALKGGNRGLYLEYYEKGFRKRENLHLYLIPEDAPDAKRINKRTYLKAMAVRSDRLLNPPEFEKKPETEDGIDTTTTWLEWCDEYIRYSADCGNSDSAMQHKNNVRKRINEYLDRIGRTDILLKDVTSEVISGLYDYMRNDYRNPGQIKVREGRLADFSLLLFGETINAIFNKALRDGRIGFNPLRGLNKLERFHAPDKHREYLTPEELVRFLAVAPSTENERQVQKAFGFSCMTGLRLGDIQRLRWGNIKPLGDGWAVSIVQHKTGSPVTVPLNELALSLLPPRPEDEDENVFRLPKRSGVITKYVCSIRDKAGITGKELTYHCSRHTAATLAISAGAELYSVSKILGHRTLVSTQVYAKVNLEKKIEAVNLTKGLFV